jgi:4-hydroxy-tetrahydrodipicolinate reductase
VVYRVAQWSLGNVGTHALRAILGRPDMQLVGVYTHTAEKVGRDAGELAGIVNETGVIASDNAAALLAENPDCIVYTSLGETRPKAAVAELVAILSSGANVVSSSMMDLINPSAADHRAAEPLTRACEVGRSTLFTSGIDPGFTGDTLPSAALQLCRRADTVRVQELFVYGNHSDPSWALPYGFGLPEGAPAPILDNGMPTRFWGGMVQLLARTLDVEIDGITEYIDRRYAKESFDVPLGHMGKGTLVGVRFQVAGVVAGVPRLFADHVTRMREDIAPDWPQPSPGHTAVHRVEITGDPSLTLDLHFTGRVGPDHNESALIATAARVVNAIPAVVDASPGIATTFDLRLGERIRLLAEPSV